MRNSFYNAWDTARWSGKSDDGDYRSAFQIDRDRVLHTPTFRRLQNKTQVFWSGEYDFYRTRLTHSLEVAQIGRSICHWLLSQTDGPLAPDHFIDPDLVEASCLSHDLGHPPFGHAGERSLNHLMQEHGGFEGNAQTLRILTERIFSSRRSGMDPSRAFVDGILKYKSLWTELKSTTGKIPHNHFLYDDQQSILDWVIGGNDFPLELPAGRARDSFKSIECQIMDWADDTAYSLNDISDSVRAGFLGSDKIIPWAEQNNIPCGEGTPLGDLLRAIQKRRVDPFVGKRIGLYIRATRLTEQVNFLSHQSQRYRYQLLVDPAVSAESELFKKLAFDLVFLSPQLKQLEHKGNHMLRALWELLEKRYIAPGHIDGQHFQILSTDSASEIEQAGDPAVKARLICDFLAGMTDGYASRMYKRLFLPDFGSINDLIG